MDQNTPRDDGTGGQPPADPSQVTDQSQAATGGSQDAAAEYAAWSADASYQQQGQSADAQAYAAPEPQSATYAEPAQQAYQQPQQAYDQSAYQQQAYQQPQQQAYQQPPYQQPAYYDQSQYPQQGGYDQQAYQQGYQQQGYQAPQYYDQSAYGQQPGYYDQSQYGQQQAYQQQAYQQPYAYGQPAPQQQPWPGEAQYWEEGGSRYGRSFLAVLAGFALLTWGLVIAMGGGLLLWTNDLLGHLSNVTLSPEVVDIVERMDEQVVTWGGILVILGIMHMIGGVGVLAHRRWGRAFGIVLGLIGFAFGLAIIFSAIGWELLDGAAFDTVLTGEEASVGSGVFVAGTYLLVLLGMFVGRRHFKKRFVDA